ncbi:hypothetical protein BpHYR1_016730 [Brachionus plicatilis]|uniref:Uncharacterized protein n=1 Tax=Brachionus plicatilis TaxID=10195 RepID=A0A3M7QLH9_BRAPC|nr:hypothetical protein BpHYR1_016730 [Brachionus plicatilis]
MKCFILLRSNRSLSYCSLLDNAYNISLSSKKKKKLSKLSETSSSLIAFEKLVILNTRFTKRERDNKEFFGITIGIFRYNANIY